MKIRSIQIGITLTLPFLLLSNGVQASIYKCVNVKGETVYHDKPCSLLEFETKLQSVKDPVNGYIPPEFKNAEKQTHNAKKVVIGNSNVKREGETDRSKDKVNDSNNNASDGNSEESKLARKLATSTSNQLEKPPSFIDESKKTFVMH